MEKIPAHPEMMENLPQTPEILEKPTTPPESSELMREMKKLRKDLQEIKYLEKAMSPTSSENELTGFLPPKIMGFAKPKETVGDATLAHLAQSQARQRQEVEPEALSIMLGGGGFQLPPPLQQILWV